MSTLAARFTGWVCAPADARTAAAVRIGFGSVWLFMLWDLHPTLDLLLGNDGVLPPSGGFGALVFGLLGTHAWFWLSVAAAVATVLGLGTRIAVVACYVLLLGFQERNPYLQSGADTVLRHVGLWLIFLDCGRTWALDGRATPGAEVSGWPLRAIRIQVALIYLSAFLHKIVTTAWRDGTALHDALAASDLANRIGERVLGVPWLLPPLTYAVLAIELAVPFLLFVPATRRGALLVALGLHLGIDLVLSIRFFSLTMFVGLAAFLEAPDWALCEVRLRRCNRSGGSPTP